MQHKVRAWVTFGDETKFGEGRAELLRLVDAEGSLLRAVKELGMSYRAAWGYLRELEDAAGFAIVRRVGSGPSGGMRLTPQGRALVTAFETFRAELAATADRAFAEAFRAIPATDGARPGKRARRAKRKTKS